MGGISSDVVLSLISPWSGKDCRLPHSGVLRGRANVTGKCKVTCSKRALPELKPGLTHTSQGSRDHLGNQRGLLSPSTFNPSPVTLFATSPKSTHFSLYTASLSPSCQHSGGRKHSCQKDSSHAPQDKGNTTMASSSIAEREAVQWAEARKGGKGQIVTCCVKPH